MRGGVVGKGWRTLIGEANCLGGSGKKGKLSRTILGLCRGKRKKKHKKKTEKYGQKPPRQARGGNETGDFKKADQGKGALFDPQIRRRGVKTKH